MRPAALTAAGPLGHKPCLREVRESQLEQSATTHRHSRDHENRSKRIEPVQQRLQQLQSPACRDTRRDMAHDKRPRDNADARTHHNRTPAAAPELIAVAPRGELGTQRLPDAHQLEPLVESSQADVFRGDTLSRRTEASLAILDRLPALFERRQVPTLALATHRPQAALGGVEGQPPPDGERLDD